MYKLLNRLATKRWVSHIVLISITHNNIKKYINEELYFECVNVWKLKIHIYIFIIYIILQATEQVEKLKYTCIKH